MTVATSKVKTKGISPKVVADFLATAASFAIMYYGLDVDPELSALLAKLLGSGAGITAPPGKIEVESPVVSSPTA